MSQQGWGYGGPPGHMAPGPYGYNHPPPKRALSGAAIALVVLAVLFVLGGASCMLCIAIGKPTVAAPPARGPSPSGLTPYQACSLLESSGLRSSQGWQKLLEPEYGCATGAKSLGGKPIENDLTYFAEGDARGVKRLKLSLDVFDRSRARFAHQALLDHSIELVLKALHVQFPDAARDAILGGGSSVTFLVGTTVSVSRDDFPSGRGYGLRFTIEW